MAGFLDLGKAVSSGGLGLAGGTTPTGNVSFGGNAGALNTGAMGGSVLGASTTAPSVASSGSAPATNTVAPDASSLLPQAQSGINKQYDYITQALDAQAGHLPEDHQNLVDQVNNLFQGNVNTVESQRAGANAQLDASRGQVASRQATSFRDLEGNTRNALEAGNRRIGAMCAGDSSGADMYKYALAKQSNQQRGQILSQAGDLYNQINMKAADIGRTYDDQVNKLTTWKADNLKKIQTDISAQKAAIDQQKTSANAQRQAELNNIWLQVKQQGMQALQKIQQQSATSQQAIDGWAQGHAQNLSGLVDSINQGAIPSGYVRECL